jgi:hypothetical protein
MLNPPVEKLNDIGVRSEMPIASAVERGAYVYIYDERGRQLASIPKGSREDDGLQGYTGSTVSVRRGSYVYIHDERGREISAVPSGR